jgi:hypothetical protein
VYNAADNATIVLPLDTAHIGRQVRLDPLPLRIAQPKQIPAHDPILPQENQYRIVTAENLMSSHPRFCGDWLDCNGRSHGITCFEVRSDFRFGLAFPFFRLGEPKETSGRIAHCELAKLRF